jgi:hypothetical protein
VNDVPPAVRKAAPAQQLPVGGVSPLPFSNQTLRKIANMSVGGQRVCVVLANVFGTLPLRIGAARVALHDKGPGIAAGSNRVLTSSGLAQPVVPPGAILVSDPADLAVPDCAELIVDIYRAVARELPLGAWEPYRCCNVPNFYNHSLSAQ